MTRAGTGHPAFALLLAAVLIALVGIASNVESFPERTTATTTDPRLPEAFDAPPVENDIDATDDSSVDQAPSPLPPIVIWIMAGVLVAASIYALIQQPIRIALHRRKRLPASDPVPTSTAVSDEEIADASEILIAELQDGDDPREAIRRVYALVETGFGSRELQRKRSETPGQYLERMFGSRAEAADALRGLTELFEVARFSTRPMDESMRAEALEQLLTIRDTYRQLSRTRARRTF